MRPIFVKTINFLAWMGFCGCGLLMGISISQFVRMQNTVTAFQMFISAIAAVVSILMFKYTDEKPEQKV